MDCVSPQWLNNLSGDIKSPDLMTPIGSPKLMHQSKISGKDWKVVSVKTKKDVGLPKPSEIAISDYASSSSFSVRKMDEPVGDVCLQSRSSAASDRLRNQDAMDQDHRRISERQESKNQDIRSDEGSRIIYQLRDEGNLSLKGLLLMMKLPIS
jgi:hypothetical protein